MTTIYHKAKKEIPDDIADYIGKELACDHFEGEYGYDENRKIGLENAKKTIGCDDLGVDRLGLADKYLCPLKAVDPYFCP